VFDKDNCPNPATQTGVGEIDKTSNYAFSGLSFTATGCVTKGSANALNHFEIRISQTRVEVWGSDAGSTVVRQIAVAANPDLTLTRGVVWLETSTTTRASSILNATISSPSTTSDSTVRRRIATCRSAIDKPRIGLVTSILTPSRSISRRASRVISAHRRGWVLMVAEIRPSFFQLNGVRSTDGGPLMGDVHMATIACRCRYRDGRAELVVVHRSARSLENINVILIAGSPVP
jgi:hypothetical protein